MEEFVCRGQLISLLTFTSGFVSNPDSEDDVAECRNCWKPAFVPAVQTHSRWHQIWWFGVKNAPLWRNSQIKVGLQTRASWCPHDAGVHASEGSKSSSAEVLQIFGFSSCAEAAFSSTSKHLIEAGKREFSLSLVTSYRITKQKLSRCFSTLSGFPGVTVVFGPQLPPKDDDRRNLWSFAFGSITLSLKQRRLVEHFTPLFYSQCDPPTAGTLGCGFRGGRSMFGIIGMLRNEASDIFQMILHDGSEPVLFCVCNSIILCRHTLLCLNEEVVQPVWWTGDGPAASSRFLWATRSQS